MIPIIVIVLLLIFLQTGSIKGTIAFVIYTALKIILIIALLVAVAGYFLSCTSKL